MKFTRIGVDYVTITEEYIRNLESPPTQKIHLIKIDIKSPDYKSMEAITMLYPETNRYVISSASNIRIYNEFFKKLQKKYYVENGSNSKLVSFLRKNNKILLNICNLNSHDYAFVNNANILADLLWNCEVVQAPMVYYDMWKQLFSSWSGNLIII